ncbi:SurA N-terminal domain-containing protein [Erythrobacter sp. JK5]|uniref:SurA N-terminal domain-containing protein n=1 Tax=Erythrobacter sp. JK5 TaxID=2829500 RepID=UPI001BA8E2E2|nr:SurA N-terminal domain-containing protein [Erythrobacter sp. JK5]QUL38658.1 SurA N-terminal domain-containing protein [Erythrobacter sp. JK5]
MISGFRKFFQSKIGLAITFLFIGLIALAFAASDITGSTFGGVSGGDRAAIVGDDRISTAELISTANSALRQMQRENPTLTMAAMIEQGGFDEVLDQLIDRYAIGGYAEKYGLRAGDNLVNSEILQVPAFRGVSGEFDRDTYLAALRQQGVTDAALRRDLADGMLAQQLLIPAFAAPQMPAKVAKHYAALVLERRRGQIALIPSEAFAPKADPTQAQLTKFYSDNRNRFVRPERRTIRFATFGADKLTANLTPTAAEIKARYDAEPARFAASETRSVSSFFVPTQDAASSIVARIRGGMSLEAAAQQAGFSVTSVENRTRAELAGVTSAAVAEAVFKTPRGQVADPARSALGFYIARVDNVTRTPPRTLAQASPELTEQLTTEKRAAALADLSARIEEEVDSGTALTEIARAYGLEVTITPQLMADGRVFGEGELDIGPALASTLDTAFQMEESEPQLAEIVPGAQFVVFDVERIIEAAAPPIAEVREEVAAAWRLYEGSKAARAAADRVLKAVRGDTTLSAALDGEDRPFPGIERVDLERRQLLARQGRGVPAPLVLLFSMAEGSTKLLEAPNDLGWYVVDLDEISAEPLAEDNPVLAQTRQQLAPALINEYTDQLTTAIRKDIEVELNATAIDAVRKQLAGES